jgi:hypothetical protein
MLAMSAQERQRFRNALITFQSAMLIFILVKYGWSWHNSFVYQQIAVQPMYNEITFFLGRTPFCSVGRGRIIGVHFGYFVKNYM